MKRRNRGKPGVQGYLRRCWGRKRALGLILIIPSDAGGFSPHIFPYPKPGMKNQLLTEGEASLAKGWWDSSSVQNFNTGAV